MRVCVFFIIDGPKIEAQACILLPSIRRMLGETVSVIAYYRQDARAEIMAPTRQVLDSCNVEMRAIPGTAPGDVSPWKEPYPIGNKIMAASDPRDCDISVFIDTDTVFIKPIDFVDLLGDAEIAAVISDYSTLSNDETGWKAFYAHFGLELPPERIRLPRGKRVRCPPYFNAGMIVFRESFGAEKRSFGTEWLADSIRFDHEVTHPFKRENIDQLTLSITTTRLGQKIKMLPNEFNFNLPAYGNSPAAPKALIHYHRFGVLWSHPEFGRLALADLQTTLGDDQLVQFLESYGPILAETRLKRLL